MTAITRRGFLELGGGLVIGCALPLATRRYLADAAPAGPAVLNAFLHIGTDDIVTVLSNHSEMGQGIWTTLPMVIAEELEADWSKVRVEHAMIPRFVDPDKQALGTGGSGSTISEFDRLRQLGATARTMLIRAAANRWRIDPAKLHAEAGHVIGGRDKLSFGQLAADAAKLAPPTKVKLKEPAQWRLIGGAWIVRRRSRAAPCSGSTCSSPGS